jgi:hypothetical protein
MPSRGAAASGALQDVVDQTKIAALPDYGNHGHHEDASTYLDVSGVPAFLEKPEKAVKMGLRLQHSMSLQREERREIWRGVFVKKEGGGEDRADANAGLYWETVKTCFGSEDLPQEAPPLPTILEPKHLHSFCLTSAGRISLSRVLNCFAYNSPDIQYAPHAYPIAAVLRHYLSGK